KAVQEDYPTMKFYLGDALLQRRDYDKNKGWREAYEALYNTMMNDQGGYDHLNFEGIRIEFDKNWDDPGQFENAQGWYELADSGAFKLIKSLGWKVGLEHNNPYADDEWEYEKVVLRTAEKSRELNLHWDFAVLHSDEAGGNGHAYPFNVAPEDRGPNDPPTFASVLNKVFDFYNNVTSIDDFSYLREGFQLLQSYPNPFNPSTTIRFSLPQREHVTLKVFDVLGREVATLVNQDMNAGEHLVQFNAERLSSGIYFYRLVVSGANPLTTPTFFQTKMMEMVK
ncbi:MAG: T9SS type A sorting domain-containing protein, partial [Ignavibacteriales bacterium]|nr:T9SS type A sorting domain-containing protein [Ignavibacteriales bacterium]